MEIYQLILLGEIHKMYSTSKICQFFFLPVLVFWWQSVRSAIKKLQVYIHLIFPWVPTQNFVSQKPLPPPPPKSNSQKINHHLCIPFYLLIILS